MALLADRVPGGFGGLYFSRDGTVTVLLKEAERASDAVAQLLALQQPNVGVDSRVTPDRVRILPATFTWRELYDWYLSMDAIIGHPGFVRSDMEPRRNQIEIEVADAATVTFVHTELARLGVPERAVDVSIGTRARWMSKLTDHIRDTIPGGYKVTSEKDACTLGVNARKVTDWGYGFVTASHCTMTYLGLDAASVDDWWQPTESGANFIGTEIKDKTADQSISQCPDVPPGLTCRYSDAAIIQYDDSTLNNVGYIERTQFGNNTVDPNNDDWKIIDDDPDCPWISLCDLASVDLQFVGQASGWRGGAVLTDTMSVCMIEVPEEDQTKRLICQDWVSARAADGDSGAPVFEIDSGNEVVLWGILWGGTTSSPYKFVYSRIRYIKQELGTFATIANPSPF